MKLAFLALALTACVSSPNYETSSAEEPTVLRVENHAWERATVRGGPGGNRRVGDCRSQQTCEFTLSAAIMSHGQAQGELRLTYRLLASREHVTLRTPWADTSLWKMTIKNQAAHSVLYR